MLNYRYFTVKYWPQTFPLAPRKRYVASISSVQRKLYDKMEELEKKASLINVARIT